MEVSGVGGGICLGKLETTQRLISFHLCESQVLQMWCPLLHQPKRPNIHIHMRSLAMALFGVGAIIVMAHWRMEQPIQIRIRFPFAYAPLERILQVIPMVTV